MMNNQEILKNKILALIDGNRDPWKKAGFYGDPTIQIIMNRLYKRWEENNRDGRPIDYATLDELKIMARLAEKYYRTPSSEIQRQYLFGIKREEKKEGVLKKLLKKIFWGR